MLFTQKDLENTSTIKHDGELIISDITCPDVECIYVSGDITQLHINNCHGKLNIIVYEGASSLIISNCNIDKLACENDGHIKHGNIVNCEINDLLVASFDKLLIDRSTVEEAEIGGVLYLGIDGSCGWERVNELQIREL